MEGAFLLVLLTAWGAKVTYHCFRYKNAYWVYPTFIGFKNRREPGDSKVTYRLLGVGSALGTIVVAIFTVKYIIQLLAIP
jgi:hypothetical protein